LLPVDFSIAVGSRASVASSTSATPPVLRHASSDWGALSPSPANVSVAAAEVCRATALAATLARLVAHGGRGSRDEPGRRAGFFGTVA